MIKLFHSATKIVFMMVAIATIAFTYLDKIDPKDFYALALVVFYHYYTKGGEKKDNPQLEQLG